MGKFPAIFFESVGKFSNIFESAGKLSKFEKIINMNFDFFFKKTLCLGKMGITFAYEVGLKVFYMKKYQNEKLHPNSTTIGRFDKF
jgi:hypothetical protein